MSIDGAASLYPGDIPTSPFSGWADALPALNVPARAASANPGPSDDHRAPATRIDLSDKVKDILARAGNDQDVADRLKAFVESHRTRNAGRSAHDNSAPSSQSSGTDVNEGFAQLSGNGQAADDSQDYQPVEVARNFATGLKADGYTISALGRANDGSFQIAIFGPGGTSFLDRRFGTSGEFSGFGNLGPGTAAQAYQRGNKEYITFSESQAAATSVTASSDAGSVSATSSATHTASVTFVVDFSTGGISMLRSESTSVSTAVQITQPGSAFSATA
jgi:hypothetical protein